MASQMMDALMALCQERHIDELYLLDRLEQSLAKSYADVLHLQYGAKVTIDRATGKVYVYKLVPVGEPDEETGEYAEYREVDVTPKNTSRIAAQQAKVEIKAIVRNAARQQIYEEFSDRVGDIITGTVLQSTPDFEIVKIREGVEAELPHFDQRRFPEERNERPAGERYSHNQRLKALIIDVRDPNSTQQPVRGERQRPPIVISRTHPALISRLFELEVPEVYDRVVEVRSVAREPGVRSKVAVSSNDEKLDPVGACVGPKGSRVRTVVSELRGERVDVVLWSDDPARCVANALSPAKVSRVIVDAENKYATVIVPDDQLSLAIGKEGQNARLAARLTGYHIDIKNESLARDILRDIPSIVSDEVDEVETDGRCEYIFPDGRRCRNSARPGSLFCGLHERLDALAGEDVRVSDDPDSLI
ncbi:MAG: transcription termination/antitermination protein NusA [Atopobiaceae bacterium]|nr:transcription termination/antitermination protein NusA [Atopobiaceae bacterium]